MALPIALLILGLAGVYLFAFRGLRAGTSPHCASCGYDLAGIDSPTTCPECGSDLDHDLAIRRGGRRKKPILALVFSVVLLLGGTLVGYRLFLTTSNMPMAQRPVWLLTLDVRLGVPERSSLALRELLKRRSSGKIGETPIVSLIDTAIAKQSGAGEDWLSTAWAELLYEARANGFMTDEQFERYKANCLDGFEITLFDEPVIVRAGEPFERIEWNHNGTPAVANFEQISAIIYPLSLKTRDGQPLQLSPREAESGDGWMVEKCGFSWSFSKTIGGGGFTSTSHGSTAGSSLATVEHSVNALKIEGLPPGEHEFTGEFRIEYFLHDKPIVNNAHIIRPGLPDERIRAETVEADFTVRVIDDPCEALACYDNASSISSPNIKTRGRPNGGWVVTRAGSEGKSYQLKLYLSRQPVEDTPPYLVSGNLHVLIDGEAVPLSDENRVWDTRFTFEHESHRVSFSGFTVTVDADKLPRTETADFVLVPDPWYVVERRDEREYWNDEIILKDVALDWSRVPAGN